MTVATIAAAPGVRPFVELGVGASYDSTSTAQWDVDHWDDASAHWVSDLPYWFDVTCHVQDVATFAGRERAIDQFEVGTATISLDNRDGLFDFPLSMADLADDATLLSVRPGRSVRVGVEVPVDTLPPEPATRTVLLWAGYIDAANPAYDAVEGDRMILECIDAKGDAGRAAIGAVAAPVGAAETVTARINRVLTAAGWPTYRRAVETSGVTLIATELGSQCVDLLNIAADSAAGSIYGDVGANNSDPRVAYRNSEFPNYDGDDLLTGTIGDYGSPGVPASYAYTARMTEGPAGLYVLPDEGIVEEPAGSGLFYVDDPGVLLHETPTRSGLYLVEGGGVIAAIPADTCPSNWELSFARADITTKAFLSRPDDATPRVYPTSTQLADLRNGFKYGQSMFGIEPFERTDLETLNNTDLDFLGERILTTRSWKHMPRVAAVTVTAKASAPQTIHTLASSSPFDPARFRCQHLIDGRVVFNRIMFVTGVAHSITPTGWEARISLDDAEPFLVGGALPARWDELDIAVWDAATWADPT
jgi:hypothetical protein